MDKQNNSLYSNLRHPGIGVVVILLLTGAVIGFQLGRWSGSYEINNLLSPTPVSCTLEAKICPDGSSVGRTGPNCEFAPCPLFNTVSPSPAVTGSAETGCKRTGCSGQLCISEDNDDMMSTCEVRKEFGCLQYSRCELQKNGACGWTQTPSYTDCLDKLQK